MQQKIAQLKDEENGEIVFFGEVAKQAGAGALQLLRILGKPTIFWPLVRCRSKAAATGHSSPALVPIFPAPTLALAGERRVYGGNGWTDGPLDEAGKQQALGKLG